MNLKIHIEGNIQEYEIKEKLGQRNYGCVYKVINKKDKNIYVLKQIILREANKEEIETIKKEATILSKIKNDYIVKYYDSFIDNNSFIIIMEFCDGLDLRKLLEEYKNQNKHLDEKIIYNYILELCLGLKNT